MLQDTPFLGAPGVPRVEPLEPFVYATVERELGLERRDLLLERLARRAHVRVGVRLGVEMHAPLQPVQRSEQAVEALGDLPERGVVRQRQEGLDVLPRAPKRGADRGGEGLVVHGAQAR